MMEIVYAVSLLQLTVLTEVCMKIVQWICEISGTNDQINIISHVYV